MEYINEYKKILGITRKRFPHICYGIVEDGVQYGYLKWREYEVNNKIVSNHLNFIVRVSTNYIKDVLKEKFRGVKRLGNRDIIQNIQMANGKLAIMKKKLNNLAMADRLFLETYLENRQKRGTIHTRVDHDRFYRIKKELRSYLKSEFEDLMYEV